MVAAANTAEFATPKRCSTPSIDAPTAVGTVPWCCSWNSIVRLTLSVAMNAITATIASPCLRLSTIRPNVRGSENAIIASRKSSTQLVHVVGFSKGWAELALKKPPPLVPSSLMASWLATGPPGIVCCAPASVPTTWSCSAKFWITPPEIRMAAAMTDSGNRIRMTPRTRSTQKLPSSPVLRRDRPRTNAIATAMPTADETKFCTVNPAICTRWPWVDSPE